MANALVGVVPCPLVSNALANALQYHQYASASSRESPSWSSPICRWLELVGVVPGSVLREGGNRQSEPRSEQPPEAALVHMSCPSPRQQAQVKSTLRRPSQRKLNEVERRVGVVGKVEDREGCAVAGGEFKAIQGIRRRGREFGDLYVVSR